MLALSREHERQVQIREETAERLAKANEANLALHEELMAQATSDGQGARSGQDCPGRYMTRWPKDSLVSSGS